ncbi:MAG TPA: metallophosphoesterase [Candidatus Binataceae bacterium]|nr:metallophosphoesterase [Candidatus Binataceae bacterium]
MDPIKLAHISDLHFGLSGQTATWNLLKDHLKDQIKPDLILITGDLADNPKQELFREALDALIDLCTGPRGITPCWVCPGNHDRFWHGNRLWESKLGQWLWRPSSFESYFNWFLATLGNQTNLVLGPQTNRWTLRILGLDSSREADRFARGRISLPELQRIADTMLGSSDIDLGLMLVHHHVLSVRALEQKNQNSPLKLLNVTSLTNSGSLLEALACAHVDVVLHGHEHAANWGRYTTITGGGGETTVIAAGSSTGVADSVRCEQDHGTYNLFELWPDRSVTMRVRKWNAGQWDAGTYYRLFESEDVRRSRSLRRSGQILERPTTSEIVKSVQFTRDGDGRVHEARSDWLIEENKWSLLVSNDTGVPTDLNIRFRRPNGREWRPPVDLVFKALGKKNADDPRQFYFDCNVDPAVAGEPLGVQLSYNWQGGAVLTADEMDIVKKMPEAGPLRRLGYEFAAATAVSSLRTLRLLVEVPAEVAPADADVQVFQQEAKGDPHQFSSPPDLVSCLRVIRTGVYALTVPYPLKNYRYVIAWEPPRREPSPKAARFIWYARRNGLQLARLFHQSVAPNWGDDVVCSMYVPEGARQSRLELLGSWPALGTPRPSPVDLHENSEVMSEAWRGNVGSSAIVPEERRVLEAPALGMLDDERALVAVPVRLSDEDDFAPPPGVIRVGIREGAFERARSMLDLVNLDTLQAFVERAIFKMLAQVEPGD